MKKIDTAQFQLINKNRLFQCNISEKLEQQNLEEVQLNVYENFVAIISKSNPSQIRVIHFQDKLRVHWNIPNDSKIQGMNICIGLAFHLSNDECPENLEKVKINVKKKKLIKQQHSDKKQEQQQNEQQKQEKEKNIFINTENSSNLIPENEKLEVLKFEDTILVDFQTKQNSILQELYQILKKKVIMQHFHQHFKAIKKLGKGSFASVYLVHQRETNKRYAIKAFLKEKLLQEEKGYLCFYNEVNIMRLLHHKHIIKLQEVWESDNSYYYVLEFCKYGSLMERVLMQRRISKNQCSPKDIELKPEEIQIIVMQLLSALTEMDKHQIMHRDIKPENILFRTKDKIEIVLSDFGLSFRLINGEILYPKCGTPGYVAPEVINIKKKEMKNARYTTSCDVFSLGVVFFFMMMLYLPFQGNSNQETIELNKKGEFNQDNPDLKKIDSIAYDLLQKMLQKDPTKRITASDALNHPYFSKQQQLLKEIEFNEEDYEIPCESPLMINQNPMRLNHQYNFNYH